MASTKTPLRYYTLRDLHALPQMQRIKESRRQAMQVVGNVLPFRANNYVVDELIDWSNIPDDPVFQLTFPQPGMLNAEHTQRMREALASGASKAEIGATADQIRWELNPHPEGQLAHNVPLLNGNPVPGVQHKYAETCLVFPSAGQTCQAYCTFCFRWAQFVGIRELKFATDKSMHHLNYLRRTTAITDVLFTGGDPMVMSTEMLARHIEPLLTPEYDHIQTIRIGTKSLTYWPYRFLSDDDSDALLRLFERIVASGKHLAIMIHFNHWRELSTFAVERAIKRLQSVGAVLRTQAPVLRYINDDAEVWTRMWKTQVRLGLIPYYMFVERETGANEYFKVPLAHALDVYRKAMTKESGLGRTARGPVMSATPGKVMIDGIAEIKGEKVFVLSFVQARNPAWCKRPFFAMFDEHASWLTELKPAFGAREFFFEAELRERFLSRETLQPSLAATG
jgi:KamA family protein